MLTTASNNQRKSSVYLPWVYDGLLDPACGQSVGNMIASSLAEKPEYGLGDILRAGLDPKHSPISDNRRYGSLGMPALHPSAYGIAAKHGNGPTSPNQPISRGLQLTAREAEKLLSINRTGRNFNDEEFLSILFEKASSQDNTEEQIINMEYRDSIKELFSGNKLLGRKVTTVWIDENLQEGEIRLTPDSGMELAILENRVDTLVAEIEYIRDVRNNAHMQFDERVQRPIFEYSGEIEVGKGDYSLKYKIGNAGNIGSIKAFGQEIDDKGRIKFSRGDSFVKSRVDSPNDTPSIIGIKKGAFGFTYEPQNAKPAISLELGKFFKAETGINFREGAERLIDTNRYTAQATQTMINTYDEIRFLELQLKTLKADISHFRANKLTNFKPVIINIHPKYK